MVNLQHGQQDSAFAFLHLPNGGKYLPDDCAPRGPAAFFVKIFQTKKKVNRSTKNVRIVEALKQ